MRVVEEILARWGQEAVLERPEGEKKTIRAFIQSREERDRLPQAAGPLGRRDERRWLYLGSETLERGDILLWRGRRLRVKTGGEHCVGGQVSHCWAELETEDEA